MHHIIRYVFWDISVIVRIEIKSSNSNAALLNIACPKSSLWLVL